MWKYPFFFLTRIGNWWQFRRNRRTGGTTGGRCYRCYTAWDRCRPHETMYRVDRGCRPLCEACWSTLPVAERKPYYWKLVRLWIRRAAQYRTIYLVDWERIRAALEAGE